MCINMTAVIYIYTLGNLKNIYNTTIVLYYICTHHLHTCVSYHINIIMTCVNDIVVINVIFEYTISTIHNDIYVLLYNYNNLHFSY